MNSKDREHLGKKVNDDFVRSQYPDSLSMDVYVILVEVLESKHSDAAKTAVIAGSLNGIYAGFSAEIGKRIYDNPVHRKAMIDLGFQAYSMPGVIGC